MTNICIYLGQMFSFNLVSIDGPQWGIAKPLTYVIFTGVCGGAVSWGTHAELSLKSQREPEGPVTFQQHY